MSKELEYLDRILNYQPLTLVDRTIIECIKEKLQRLESIENAKPSEALKEVNKVLESCYEYEKKTGKNAIVHISKEPLIEIQQALLKSQELESENNALLEKNNDLYAELTLANKQYKELIESTKQYQKVLEIIKEKSVDVFRFKKLDFNTFNQLQRSCKLPELAQDEFNLLKEVLSYE